jgi:hypothetical protein
LITEQENAELRSLFDKYFRIANSYILSIGRAPGDKDTVNEEAEQYGSQNELDNYLTNENFPEP